MDRITEALGKILPAEQVAEVRKAVEEVMAEHFKTLEAEYEAKLEEAYEELTADKQKESQIAEAGYQQAYEIISGLMRRIDEQREEFETALEEGFEEAYQELQKEKGKNENVEVELYEEFDKKLKGMMDLMVDKVDEFLSLQEAEMYDEAMRNLLSDPRLAEQRVIVSKMAELLSDYIDSDSLVAVGSSKIEEATRTAEELRGQLRILEAKNLRLATTNNKLNEQVRQAQNLLTEAAKVEKKERVEKVKNASGRGQRVVGDQIISEYVAPAAKSESKDTDLREGHDPLNDILVLSGIQS